MGVDTSPVPPVLCEQMNLARGFGLVVDYVVPNGPAATAGVQPNDILKMLNDQILLEPSQLSKLIRSYSEGTTITLTILRKGKEEKVTVKLGKKEVPQKREFMHHGDFPFGDHDFGDMHDYLNDLKDQIAEGKPGMIHDAVMKAQSEAQRVRDEAQRHRDEAQRMRDAAQRVRDAAQRAGKQMKAAFGKIEVTRSGENGLKTTKIDMGKAEIVFSDDKGELRIENANGKKMLTAKDPQGKLLFSGPVETKEDRDKMPAEVRQRFENLQEKDLPSVVSSEDEDDGDDEADDDSSDSDDGDDSGASVEQVSTCPQTGGGGMHEFWMFRTIFI